MKTAKKEYYLKKFTDATSNIKQTWKLITEVLNRDKSKTPGPNKIKIGNKTTVNKDDFNEFDFIFLKIWEIYITGCQRVCGTRLDPGNPMVHHL